MMTRHLLLVRHDFDDFSDQSASNRSVRSESDGVARDAVTEGFNHSETDSVLCQISILSLLTSFIDDVRLWRDCRTVR